MIIIRGEINTMEKLFNSISIILAIAGGVAAKIFGAWDAALWTLVALMCLDYATGLIKAQLGVMLWI